MMSDTTQGTSGKLGEILTLKENISKDQLEDALQIQKEYQQLAVPFRLGELLVETNACSATTVSRTLHTQRDQQVRSNSVGQILMELGFVTKPQLEEAMQAHMDIMAPVGEILVDQGICTDEQLQKALSLQHMRRVSAIRRPLSSSFDPVNVMASN